MYLLRRTMTDGVRHYELYRPDGALLTVRPTFWLAIHAGREDSHCPNCSYGYGGISKDRTEATGEVLVDYVPGAEPAYYAADGARLPPTVVRRAPYFWGVRGRPRTI